jgi:hypothetical protein
MCFEQLRNGFKWNTCPCKVFCPDSNLLSFFHLIQKEINLKWLNKKPNALLKKSNINAFSGTSFLDAFKMKLMLLLY